MRLAQSPASLVSQQYSPSANMERVMKAQALRDDRYLRPDQNRVMEINPRHPVVKKLLRLVQSGEQNQDTADNVRTLHDMAVLQSGFSLKDTQPLSGRISRMMALSLSLDPNEPVEEEAAEPIEEEAVKESSKAGEPSPSKSDL